MPRKSSSSRGRSPAPARSESPAARPSKPSPSPRGHDSAAPPCPANEFLGPVGTFFIMLSLPVTVLFLYYACPNKGEGFCLQGVDLLGLRQMTLPVPSMLVTPPAKPHGPRLCSLGGTLGLKDARR